MAFTTVKNYLALTFRDVRENDRLRRVELGPIVIITDADAERFHTASKSAVVKYVQQNVQRDTAKTSDADSEVRDTLRLYFRLDDDSIGHLDIPDPHDELFLSTIGPGANVLKDKADLDLATIGTPEDAVGEIIDKVLAGDMLISDGETPNTYLNGERVTWR